MDARDVERLTRAVADRAAALALYARQWLDAAAAEDVVQEALIGLLAQRQPPERPVAWMFRAVRNAAIDETRARARRRRREQAVAQTRSEWFESRPDALLDARTAEAALAELSCEYRQVVVMRIWGQLRFGEIADVLELSASTVHARYGAALRQLRQILEKSCKNETK